MNVEFIKWNQYKIQSKVKKKISEFKNNNLNGLSEVEHEKS